MKTVSIQYVPITSLLSDGIEIIAGSFNANGVIVVSVYKPPIQHISKVNEKLKTVIEQCSPNQFNKVVVVGDLNENLLQPSTEFNMFLEHIRTCYSLQPCNFQQTTDYHSCLDHVYTNIDASVGIQEAYWTDHKLVWLQIQSNLSYVTFKGNSEIWSHKTGDCLIQV